MAVEDILKSYLVSCVDYDNSFAPNISKVYDSTEIRDHLRPVLNPWTQPLTESYLEGFFPEREYNFNHIEDIIKTISKSLVNQFGKSQAEKMVTKSIEIIQ